MPASYFFIHIHGRSTMRNAARTLAAALLGGFAASAAAGFDSLLQQGLDAATKSVAPASTAPQNAASTGQAAPSGAPTTYTHAARRFSYTIPGGWQLTKGDPTGESVSFMLPGTTVGFNMNMTQMVPSFPAKASVDASLKQSKEEVTINKLLSAKRRDDWDKKKKCGIIGWEIIESGKGSDTEHQRIIWQGYDADNYYFNFMTFSHPREFAQNQALLQGVLDSIKFCKN
jgi:hypothetical protein